MAFWATLLILGAALGHTALMVFTINYLYGTRYRGWWVTGIRWLCQLLIVAGPPVFVFRFGPTVWPGHEWTALPPLLLSYVIACWALGSVVVYQTVQRWRRKLPAVQFSNDTETIDVAKRLGFRPIGRGKHRWLAHLPFNQIFQVDLVERTFALPQLPAEWDGLTILHVTDLHLCGIPDRAFYDYVLDLCRDPVPDIVALTGDILDSEKHYRWIIPFLSRLRWRLAAFAVLGNHDSWLDVNKISRRIERLGIEPMGHRWKQVEVRGQPLIVIGNEMPWLPPAPDLTQCPAEGFRLCLSHSPDTMPWARRNRIDLLLAGHNHGGQVRIPGFGSVLVPSKFSRKYDCGLFYEPPTLLHVGRGLGGTYPLRWFCRPEITRIVLRTSPLSLPGERSPSLSPLAPPGERGPSLSPLAPPGERGRG